MDTPEKPQRPWWRKKRWQTAVVIWLALPPLYVLSVGPAIYVDRRWCSLPLDSWYRPITERLLYGPGFARDSWNCYLAWWDKAAMPYEPRPIAVEPIVRGPTSEQSYAAWRERFVTAPGPVHAQTMKSVEQSVLEGPELPPIPN